MLLGSWSSCWNTSMFLQVPSLQPMSHKAGVSERRAATTTRRRGTAAPMRSRVALAWPSCVCRGKLCSSTRNAQLGEPHYFKASVLTRHRPNLEHDNQTSSGCICFHTLCTANFPNFFKHTIRVAVEFLPVTRCCFGEHTTTYKKQLNPHSGWCPTPKNITVPSTKRPSTDPNIFRININSLYSLYVCPFSLFTRSRWAL